MLSADWRFHHIGVACKRIETEFSELIALGYQQEGDFFKDPIQQIRGVFLTGPGPRLELVEELSESGVLNDWIGRGTKFYHQAFEVSNFEHSVEQICQNLKARLIKAPVPSVAFNGRRICFVMTRSMYLWELIET